MPGKLAWENEFVAAKKAFRRNIPTEKLTRQPLISAAKMFVEYTLASRFPALKRYFSCGEDKAPAKYSRQRRG